MVTLVNDRLLVVAVRLVASLKFCQMVNISVSIGISLNYDLIGCGTLNNTGILSNYTNTGVNRCLALNTGTNNRCLSCKKRNGLTLHVGTHQRTVRVIVLQERDHGCRYGEYHLRRDIHQVDGTLLEGRCLLAETTGYVIVNKVSILVQRLVRLCYDEVILFVSCQVNNFVCYTRVGRICFINQTVRSLNKTVRVYSCVSSKGVDKTDVRTLRSLDRAHTTVVCVVYVSNLETCTLSGKTART